MFTLFDLDKSLNCLRGGAGNCVIGFWSHPSICACPHYLLPVHILSKNLSPLSPLILRLGRALSDTGPISLSYSLFTAWFVTSHLCYLTGVQKPKKSIIILLYSNQSCFQDFKLDLMLGSGTWMPRNFILYTR